jgi:hypothetical protein
LKQIGILIGIIFGFQECTHKELTDVIKSHREEKVDDRDERMVKEI